MTPTLLSIAYWLPYKRARSPTTIRTRSTRSSNDSLLRELENLETKITPARNVTIQPGNPEVQDDLADALALGIFLAREHEIAQEEARRRGLLPTAAWT